MATDLPENDGGGGDNVAVGDTTPPTQSGDWAAIATFAAGHTDSKPTNFSYLSVGTLVDLAGTYTVLSVTSSQIVLSNPALVNPSWTNIGAVGSMTATASSSLSTSGERWVGPFETDLDNLDRVLSNFVALQGLYEISKKGAQYAISKSVEIELTPTDLSGSPIGPAEYSTATLTGSDTNKDEVQVSLWSYPTFTGRCQIRARRLSPTNLDNKTTVVDEIKWRDTYSMAAVSALEFGDVTTVHVRSYATNGALSVKDRKFNLKATRRLPARISGSEFGAPVPTDSADDIISAICLDPFIGRRSAAEVDFDNIYDTIAEVKEYFGSELAGEFGFTFDDSNVSFEETIAAIAQTVFCSAYRQGRVIRLAFERATEDSTLIFNARNTLPGTQQRTVRFGPLDDHDGVTLDYAAPADGAPLTYSIPAKTTAVSPRTLDIKGIRSDPLAYWQAWRAWNRVLYQNVAVELTATQEGQLVIPRDRVLIADRTRPNILQGDVEAEDGLTLTLSHDAVLDPGQIWTIFLQHIDGSVEALGVTSTTGDTTGKKVTLSAAPRLPLSVDAANFARATYMIVPDDDKKSSAFLITEREPSGDFAETIRAVGYSFLYYQHDELILWLAFESANFYDSGPYSRDGTAAGGATTTTDTIRGVVYDGATGRSVTFPVFTPPTSYTKAVWVRRADLTTAGAILEATHEMFGFAASAAFQAGHDGVQVSAPWPNETDWHHGAVTYDATEGEMALYIDGLLVDSAPVAARTLAQLVAFDGLTGVADDLRLWKRALSPREILEVYRASRISGTTTLLTETGSTLTTEDGLSLSLE